MKKNILLVIFILALPFFLIAEQPNSPEFKRGYVYAKLENKFPNAYIDIDVVSTKIIVYNWPAYMDPEEIKGYLEFTFPNYAIEFNQFHQVCHSVENQESCELYEPYKEETLLPELNPFFPTMLAQPHILGYSVGYRSYDRIFKSTLPVSIGDQFSLYQFPIKTCGKLFFGIEACVWAVFEGKTKSLSLINADYFVSLPLTYVNNKFSARLRVFHQSSHLGDEYMLEHPNIVRLNPSMEGVDISLAYEPIEKLVYFIGYSRIFRSDDSFKVKPNNIFYGFNYFFDFAKISIFNVDALPYIATYFTNNENNHWRFDSSAAIGYEWNKSYGRKLRIYTKAIHGKGNLQKNALSMFLSTYSMAINA